MSGSQLLALGLLLVAGFLVGGVVSFARSGARVPAVVCGILAVLAVGGGVLRLLPG